MKRKVLITGAAGRIGSFVTNQWVDRYDLLLSDIREPAETHGFPFVEANLADFDAVRGLCEGVDTVVHLGADPSMQATWESLLPNNVIAVYNVFEAAEQAGCRRVIFASSVNAVFGYPHDVQVTTDMPVRPPNLYGASKAWGEAVASFYGFQKEVSAICLRFGWVVDRESPAIKIDHPYLDIALTYHDLAKLVASAIDAPDDIDYAVFHGVSNNRWKRLDISDARRLLGYEPEDDSFALARLHNPAEI
ncbi:MAG: NAD(P)-dependent oxidoreductase [Caldilineaceae bacterium]|nr:NAD(P)-dependent oxidoreductase [Caldilineaceae bacterium]